VAEKILPAIPDRLIRKLVFLVLISLGFSLLIQPGSFA